MTSETPQPTLSPCRFAGPFIMPEPLAFTGPPVSWSPRYSGNPSGPAVPPVNWYKRTTSRATRRWRTMSMSYFVPVASFTKKTWLEQFRLGARKSLGVVWTCRHHDKQPPTLSFTNVQCASRGGKHHNVSCSFFMADEPKPNPRIGCIVFARNFDQLMKTLLHLNCATRIQYLS